MNYSALKIGKIFDCKLKDIIDSKICEVSIDSRKILSPSQTLFFALKGEMSDGHHHIEDAYSKGVRNFVVENGYEDFNPLDANFFQVDNVLIALQSLATYHRKQHPNGRRNLPIKAVVRQTDGVQLRNVEEAFGDLPLQGIVADIKIR